MTEVETPPGSPGDLTIHIRELCLIARVHTVYFYTQVREGKAPKPRRGRIPLREAVAWLERRAEKYSDRAAGTSLRIAASSATVTRTVSFVYFRGIYLYPLTIVGGVRDGR